jgi:uncharacterized protein YecE (DUF72 family)
MKTKPVKGVARVGISGWRYPAWRNVFYPRGLAQKRELEFASRQLSTIEINGSFYSLQRPSSYEQWRNETPDDFVFAVKGGRFITHNKKLRDCGGPLANFFASGPLALEEKLGPILWQLPPQLGFDAERLESFFASLPRTTMQAGALAQMHDERVKHGAYVHPREDKPIRHALEVRHESFHDPAFLKLLRKWDIGLCIADTAGKWPFIEDVTADFVYIRLHGSKRLYASGYTNAELDVWSQKIDRWLRRRRDVFVYFDNDVKVRAPFDAINLAARLGQGVRQAFPRKLHREAEKTRGVEEIMSTWDRWRYGRRSA